MQPVKVPCFFDQRDTVFPKVEDLGLPKLYDSNQKIAVR